VSSVVSTVRERVGKFRFAILWLIFGVTVLNYADRAVLSLAAPAMSKELHLSSVSLGFVFSAFAWSYVVAQLPSGLLLDRFGAKWVYAGAIAAWSLFTALTGATGFITGALAVLVLFTLRLLVGLAEGPLFPANARIVSMWFPTNERGFASAVFNSAQYFATVLFTPLMAWIVHDFGWRTVFWVMGAIGMLLVVVWAKSFQTPRDHPSLGQPELDHLKSGGALVDLDDNLGAKAAVKPHWSTLKELLLNRTLIGVYLAQYCIVALTYFFLTWFPVYLVKAHGLTILEAGFVAMLPALVGFFGGLLGGAISDYMLVRTGSLTLARKAPIIAGMLLSVVIIACNYVHTPWIVVAFMTLAYFGKGVGSLGWAVVADTSPKEAPGLSAGLFNAFGNIAGITTPIAIGYLVESSQGSFNSALVFVGLNAVVALVAYLFVVGDIKRVELKGSSVVPARDAHAHS
jgi:ACS family glucarate transporter-like MFS transporter